MNTTTQINQSEVNAAFAQYFLALANKADHHKARECNQCGTVALLTPYAKNNRTGLELCASCTEGVK